tara:strand:- start:357 stop:1247 length:891 start_codon:yes stop_codon:yes gene_type:complete
MKLHSVKLRDASGESHHTRLKRGDPARYMSQSDLKRILYNPYAWLMGAFKTSDAMRQGSLLDVLTLTPEDFERLYAIQPETYLKEVVKGKAPNKFTTKELTKWNINSNTCKGIKAEIEASGKQIISQDWLHTAYLARDAIRQRMAGGVSVGELIDSGKLTIQQSWEGIYTVDGLDIPVCGLMDAAYLAPDRSIIYDLKKVADASERKFNFDGRSYGYDIQAAFYSDAMAELYGPTRFGWWTVTFEKLPLTGLYSASEKCIREGRAKYERALATYAKCIKDDHFPDFTPDGFVEIDM